MKFKNGDRVVTRTHGRGIVVVEREMANNARPPRVEMVSTGRVGVQLDDSESARFYTNGVAYFWPHEMTLETEFVETKIEPPWNKWKPVLTPQQELVRAKIEAQILEYRASLDKAPALIPQAVPEKPRDRVVGISADVIYMDELDSFRERREQALIAISSGLGDDPSVESLFSVGGLSGGPVVLRPGEGLLPEGFIPESVPKDPRGDSTDPSAPSDKKD